MRPEINWFGKLPQSVLASKSPALQWGEARWRQVNLKKKEEDDNTKGGNHASAYPHAGLSRRHTPC